MNTTLCVSVRFIQPYPLFHGLRDGGEAEWPPSPLRLFQAMLNAACTRVQGTAPSPEVQLALQALEVVRPHVVAATATISSVGYRAYVPHNQGDLVSAAWYRGNAEASIASHRVEKDHRPMRLHVLENELPTVHYLYQLDTRSTDPKRLLEAIRPSVRSIHCLGWGIDQVVADAALIDEGTAAGLVGQHFLPTPRGGTPLRVPRAGSLEALQVRHNRFLNRLIGSEWTPVPPLTAFDVVQYRQNCEPVPRLCAVFKLLDPNEDPARYPHARLVHVAGMVRHLAIQAMLRNPPSWIKNPEDWVSQFIRGKRTPDSSEAHQQISYIPLPTIGHEHADALIRNVMLVAPVGMERELEFLAEQLDGLPLKPERKLEDDEDASSPMQSYRAELQRFKPPSGRFISKHYLGTSRVWHSVTPLILDGHNKKSKADAPGAIARETQKLICKALERAGIETPCQFTWQSVPFLKNTLSAHKYDRDRRRTGYHRPKHLEDLTAIHVGINFEYPVPGPLALGAGRHCGFGLMAAADDPE